MTRPARAPILVAALLFAASLALFWPGYVMYDTLAQYGQVLAGTYDDWHPPVMARLWSLIGRGAAPMLAVQLAAYWLGFGLIAARLGGRSGWAVIAIGALPLFVGWQGVVLKDAQMVGALVAATGIVAWWRLAGRRVPAAAIAAAAVLIGYATLVRSNAVFSSMPLVAMLAARPRTLPGRAIAILAGVAVAIAASSLVNHTLLRARSTGVEQTQALYDLSGIAVRAGPQASGTGLLPAETQELIEKACVRPYFWDPLGEDTRCNDTVERLRHVPTGRLYLTLVGAIVRHPLAYAGHRLAHLNSTDRWLVPLLWPGAAPPRGSEPNDLGLGSPGAAASGWQALAGWLAETPLGWPIAWIAAALVALLTTARWPATPRRALADALLVSALAQEASFAVLSIASDLRYHLWPMIATALALVLLAGQGPVPRRTAMWGAVALGLVVLAGLVARVTLPIPPQTYTGMLG